MRRLHRQLTGAAIALCVATGTAAAQTVGDSVDYSALIEERQRQQEAQQWRPLLEAVLSDIEGETPVETASGSHASLMAVSIDAAQGTKMDGRFLFVPQGSEFEEAISAHVAARCGAAARPTERRLDEASTAIQQGASIGFSMGEARPGCAGSTISFVTDGSREQRDLELRLSPELARCASGACQVRGVKGEIRLGDVEDASVRGERGWYVFAGADGTLVVWDERPSGLASLRDAVDVRDTLTMGDIEAGVMLNRGKADLSLSYVHRETTYKTWNERFVDNEDYVGLKLTID